MTADPRENARRLYELARVQGGYFTASQALAAGYAYSQHHYHHRRGTWLAVEHGLYRLRDFPVSEYDSLIRLTLWSCNRQGQPLAVISHETALAVYGLSDVMPAAVHLTVPPRFRKPAPAGVLLHRHRLTPSEVAAHEGFQITTVLRTLADVAASSLSQEHLNRAVSEALDRGMALRADLEGASARSPRLHRALEQPVT